jgi:cytochrome c-type biogenesis protein CcmH/NrfG
LKKSGKSTTPPNCICAAPWNLLPARPAVRWILRMFLAKRGRFDESESMFDQAARMAPDNAKILFERANTYIHQHRNLEQVKQLLQRYLRAQLTPDDPPRERAAFLLKKIGA